MITAEFAVHTLLVEKEMGKMMFPMEYKEKVTNSLPTTGS